MIAALDELDEANGNMDEVRLAYAASNALFCGVIAPWSLSVLTTPEWIAMAMVKLGTDVSGIIEHCVQMGTFGVELGEEALRLIDQYF